MKVEKVLEVCNEALIMKDWEIGANKTRMKELRAEIEQLKAEKQALEEENSYLQKENEQLKADVDFYKPENLKTNSDLIFNKESK